MSGEKKKNRKITEVGENNKILYADTFKIGYGEGGYIICFGQWLDKNKVEVVAKIELDDDIIQRFVIGIALTSKRYDEEFDKGIFPEKTQEENE